MSSQYAHSSDPFLHAREFANAKSQAVRSQSALKHLSHRRPFTPASCPHWDMAGAACSAMLGQGVSSSSTPAIAGIVIWPSSADSSVTDSIHGRGAGCPTPPHCP